MEHWNAAMDRIEDRLAGEVDVAELARVARTSEHHFRRMFSTLAGLPLSDYVRRRRLTRATAEIVAGSDSVLAVATSYGYRSADAFTRAFRAMHGITPSQARLPGAVLRSQPRMSFHLTIEGRSAMHHRVTEMPDFRLLGRRTRVPIVYSGENPAITAFHRALPAGFDERLRALADVDALPDPVSVTTGFEEGRAEGSSCDYHRAVATTTPAGALPEDLDVLEVGAGDWIVFEAEGPLPEALQRLWAEAFGEWFPSNPYRLVPGPEILSVTAVAADGSSGRGELWLPVERVSG